LDTPNTLIEAFTTAVATTLWEMAGVEAVARDTGRAGGEEPEDVSTVLGLGADTPGWVILSLPRATAAALAMRVLAGVGKPDEPLIRDCAAEVLNVIAGQAKALTFGTPYHFTLSTPGPLGAGAVDLGAGESIVRFDSDAGPFTLHLLPPHVTGGAGGGSPSISSGG
jgi:CheY-specific phosphatase CheX